ncbi:MAG: prepilin-type N-terminal cleavage/methylation domain-containing protein [Phycisphaerales bacterium]
MNIMNVNTQMNTQSPAYQSSRSTRSSSSGFTLVEVLIAILILALGLLGLGAVFPVVINQQREAIATVEGESVASMAETILKRSSEIVDFSPWFDPASNFGKEAASDTFFTYEWVVEPFPPYSGYAQRPGFAGGFSGSLDGFWYVNLEGVSNPPSTEADLNKALSVTDRLYPQPYSGSDPKYVWDIVARRQPGTNRPQLAVFIRNIDPNIRVSQGKSLSDALVIGVDGADPVLPVALDPATGRPVADNGLPGASGYVYAAPQSLQVQVIDSHLDWLIFEDANGTGFDTSISLATQVGQKLLDNTGTVRTVLGTPANAQGDPLLRDPNVRVVRVDPPFNSSQALDSTSNNGLTPNANDPSTDAERASWVRQVVFTPRTPLAIRVITLEESP